MKRHELMKQIDWKKALAQPRYAGGHEEVMANVFCSDSSVVLASWHEGDYQGSIVFSYLFIDGSVAIIQDSYGSCSGCDAWEDADEEDAKKLIHDMVSSARIFPSIATARKFCHKPPEDDYWFKESMHLYADLKKYEAIKKEMTFENAPLYVNDKDPVVKFISNIVLGVIKEQL